MNEGRIEQAAAPREVFDTPGTAFVARFMGDAQRHHRAGSPAARRDVVFAVERRRLVRRERARPGGRRCDRHRHPHDPVRLGEASSPGLGFTGLVATSEYRGSSVKLSINGAGIDDFTVIIDDSDFFAKPIAVGDAVRSPGPRGRHRSRALHA